MVTLLPTINDAGERSPIYPMSMFSSDTWRVCNIDSYLHLIHAMKSEIKRAGKHELGDSFIVPRQ